MRSPFWNKSKRAMLAITDDRSPFPPLSQKMALYLLNLTWTRLPFWLRMFLQGKAIALHVYQRPNLRSPFWNKSKSAIALNSSFSTKGDRPPQNQLNFSKIRQSHLNLQI